MSGPQLAIGRIVRYRIHDDGDGDRPAMVVRILSGGRVDLRVFLRHNDHASEHRLGVEFGKAPMCWHWPPGVDRRAPRPRRHDWREIPEGTGQKGCRTCGVVFGMHDDGAPCAGEVGQ